MGGLVSAVIPSHNYGHFVVDAVESALHQTWPGGVEVIVVDDGSRDDTQRRLLPYMDRIRYLYQENRGLSAARNAGIRAAQGEWVALLDADDQWHRDKTGVQLEAAKRAGGFEFVGSPPHSAPMPERLSPNVGTRRLAVEDFLRSTPLAPSAVLVRRSCFERVGLFDEGLRSAEDRDLWLRLVVHYPALQVRSPCWFYRTHSGQMSRNALRMHECYQAVLRKFFHEYPQPRRLERLGWASMYMDSAIAFLEENEPLRARQFLVQSFAWWPLPLSPRGDQVPLMRAKLLLRTWLGDRFWSWRAGYR